MITQEEFAAKQFASRHSDGTFNNWSVNNPKPANNSKPDTDRSDRFKQFFMTCAHAAADLSRAKRSQVGAVLVRDGRIVATGYNGQPYKFDNCCETVVDGSLVTKPTVVHAELNVILFCAKHGISCDGGTLYITMSPCITCAIALIQAGIKRVYYDTRYRINEGIDLLKEAGISVFQYTDDELDDYLDEDEDHEDGDGLTIPDITGECNCFSCCFERDHQKRESDRVERLWYIRK